jgi:hypothetical protein
LVAQFGSGLRDGGVDLALQGVSGDRPQVQPVDRAEEPQTVDQRLLCSGVLPIANREQLQTLLKEGGDLLRRTATVGQKHFERQQFERGLPDQLR